MPSVGPNACLVAFASFLAVATPIAAQAGFDSRQSSTHVYQYDDNDFEGYINIRDTATGRLPFQTEFAQRFVLPEEGALQYVEVCVRKPQVVSGPSADVLVYIVEFWSDAGNAPEEAFYALLTFSTGVPPGRHTCQKVIDYSSDKRTLDAGPLWVSIRWGNDPEDPNSLQDLAVDEDNSGGRRAFRVIHEEGEAWQAWQPDTEPRVYAIRLAVDHSYTNPDPEPDPDPTPGALPDPPQGPGYTDCVPEATPLLFDGGYSVRMCYETPAGDIGEGKAGIWASGESGLLWFFTRDNAEVLIKVLNGCFYNNHRWVYVAPVTDVAFNLYVTDREGRTWSHHNRQGETASTRSDNEAFPCGDQN